MAKKNGTRRRGGFSEKSLDYVEQVNEILEGLREYWPLTLRQVYYQLVSRLVIKNALNEYKKLSRNLAKARLKGLVPWEALEDRARDRLDSDGWWDGSHFLREEMDQFLRDYRRDLLQSQTVALEIWIEKDALSRICYQVAFDYCIPVVVARGFSSVSFLDECRHRVKQNAARDQQTVILYFGDMDPSGWAMLPAMMETLQEEMGLGSLVQGIRCALTPAQIEEYRLPRDPEALKPTDSRAKKYMQQFGDLAVELDALPPALLEERVREAIEEQLDLSLFEAERVRQEVERERLAALKEQVIGFVAEISN